MTTDTIANLAAALAAFQAEVTDPDKNKSATIQPKDASKRSFSYGYADLAGVLQHVRPILAKNGLSVVQDVICTDTHVEIGTLLLHSSGEGMRFGPLRLAGGDEAKSWGGAITYARRFALMAALGIAADSDDDSGGGNAGRAKGASSGAATAAQINKIQAEARSGGIAEADVLAYAKVDDLKKLTKSQASSLIEATIAEKERRARAQAVGADPTTGEVKEPAEVTPETVAPDEGGDYWPADEEAPPGDDADAARARWNEGRKDQAEGKML